MKIEATKPKLYKNYLIVAEAIEAPRRRGWRFRGIIYSQSRQELKKLELRQATVWHKRSAYYYALRMCRYWIDNGQTDLDRLLKRQRNAARAKLKMPSDRIAGMAYAKERSVSVNCLGGDPYARSALQRVH